MHEVHLGSNQKCVVLGTVYEIQDHLAREAKDAGTMTNHKWTYFKLLVEAEHVLLCANLGLSLLDRLRKDPKLREEI